MSACARCNRPLVFEIDQDDSDSDEADQSETVPDDLQLPCGCHFHWQCLLDQAADVAVSLKCPSCSTYLPANQTGPSVTNPIYQTPRGVAIPTRYHSEGGVEENLDILPVITEEAYLQAHPEARKARAFHTMCSEGDIEPIIELLNDVSEDDGDMNASDVLRYQDPLNGMMSALHIAVQMNRKETAWLLLFLASRILTGDFPPGILQSAEQVGLRRPEQIPDPDIRDLKDEKGDTANDYAAVLPGWHELVEAGILARSS